MQTAACCSNKDGGMCAIHWPSKRAMCYPRRKVEVEQDIKRECRR